MRQTKASEVKPGMKVRFDMGGWHIEGTVSRVEPVTFGLEFYSTQGVEMTLCEDTLVTVLAKPRPEEPKVFGARVTVDGLHFVRADDDGAPWKGEGEPSWWDWNDLCELGPVMVVPDQGWTVPDDTHEVPEVPEVPDRIEEWPEDDERLKDHKWRGSMGDIWSFRSGKWGYQVYGTGFRLPQSATRPFDGPWDRVTDA